MSYAKIEARHIGPHGRPLHRPSLVGILPFT